MHPVTECPINDYDASLEPYSEHAASAKHRLVKPVCWTAKKNNNNSECWR